MSRQADVFSKMTKDRIRKAHKRYENKKADEHTWGLVKSINDDGSYQVLLKNSSSTTRCSKCCNANAGDVVHVCIKADGKCIAVGRLGGDAIRNNGQGDYLAGEGIKIANLTISADVTEDDLKALAPKDHSHGTATDKASGFMSASDKAKLDSIDVASAVSAHNASPDAHSDIRQLINNLDLKIEESSGSGMFAMEVDEEGNLYAVYEDEDATPTFELDEDSNLYYVIEE